MPESILTLGTFDGVHRGHQQIIRKVVERARLRRAQSVALAFGMPPRLSVKPVKRPILLTTLPEKTAILHKLGLQRVSVLVFDRATAETSPEDFFQNTMRGKHHAREIVVGPRVAFGKNRGKLSLLKTLGQRYGVRIHVVAPVVIKGKPVSSRRIRQLLYRGHVEDAWQELGYPYSVAGRVVHGDHRGRRIGYPTANIAVDPLTILPRGVYWVKVLPGDKLPLDKKTLLSGRYGLCNVGTRPTFTPKEHSLHCEVFLFGNSGPLYGKTLRVVFLRRIRSEKRFASSQALQRQIGRDFAQAKRWGNSSALQNRSVFL